MRLKKLADIERVKYHLHPTFNPDTLSSYTKENKFLVSFNNWGKFNLSATVEFNNGSSPQEMCYLSLIGRILNKSISVKGFKFKTRRI